MKKLLFSISLLLLPVVAFAQDDTIEGFVGTIIELINNVLVPLVFAIAFIVFIWGIFQYFIASGEEGKSAGRSLMIWGLVAFFVMIAVWGLVNLLVNTFDLDRDAPVDLPVAPTGTI